MLFKHIKKEDLVGAEVEQDTLKYYNPTIFKNTTWETMRPIIADTELIHFEPVLTGAFYDEVVAAYAAYPATSMNTYMAEFVRKLQRSLSHFITFEGASDLLLTMSDMGPKEAENKEGTFSGPRQWTFNELRKKSFQKGTYFLNQALAYVAANASQTIFNTYTNSDTYKDRREYFFRSPEELAPFVPGSKAHIVYSMIQPFFREAERRYILPTLGKPFYDELKVSLKGTTALTDAQKDVLTYIRQALVKWTIRYAIPNLRLQITEQGIIEPAFDDGLNKNYKIQNSVVNNMWVSLVEGGQFFLQDLKNFIDTNVDDYPTYKASTAYSATEQKNPAIGFFHEPGGGTVGFI